MNPASTARQAAKALPIRGGAGFQPARGLLHPRRSSQLLREPIRNASLVVKGKNLCAGPRAGLGRNLQGLAAIRTTVNDSIVNDSIVERRRNLATSRNLRGAQRNGTLVVQTNSKGKNGRLTLWGGRPRLRSAPWPTFRSRAGGPAGQVGNLPHYQNLAQALLPVYSPGL